MTVIVEDKLHLYNGYFTKVEAKIGEQSSKFKTEHHYQATPLQKLSLTNHSIILFVPN